MRYEQNCNGLINQIAYLAIKVNFNEMDFK